MKAKGNLLALFMCNCFVGTWWAIPKTSVKYEGRHPPTGCSPPLVFFSFSLTHSLLYTWKNSLLLVIKPHKPTLWSPTGPRQPLKLICSISIVFANYTQSNLWPSQTIRTLSWDRGKWLNLGLSDALTGSCACAHSRQARRSAFYKALSRRGISTSNQNAPTKSQHSHRKIDPRAGAAGRGFAPSKGLWSWARMPRQCQVLFWCRSIARAIAECVALWRTSKRLRWNSLIAIETWATLFLAAMSISCHSLKRTAIH